MKVLVTGATGFVGRYVVAELLKKGQTVIATSKSQERAETYAWFPQVQYIPCDLSLRRENFYQHFRQPDLLIHLAWEGLPNYNDLFHIEKNLYFDFQFLKNMLEQGLRDLLVTGTCLEYGLQSGELHEDLPTLPATPYGLAKDTLRKSLEQLQKMVGFKLAWVRLFYMYGSGQNPKSILAQLDKALEKGVDEFEMSGGEQLRDYLPVEKVAENIVKIALQRKVAGIINCCSGVPISIRRLVENYLASREGKIHLKLGHLPYPDYEPMAFWGSSSKMNMAVTEQ